MSEAAKTVIARMALERGISIEQMRTLIQAAIHSGAVSDDLVLRRELKARFGLREPSAERFVDEIAMMLDISGEDK